MQYQSKILDHLGLVAAMFDELQIADQIDQAIEQDAHRRIVSIGEAVKAMVLNGLGFANQRLYLVPAFFQSKPTERLLGQGIRPEHLHDDTLGRALDSLYDHGVTPLYRQIAAHAAARLGLRPRFGHADTTSFLVHGTYNSEQDHVDDGVIHIRQGYSKDHRPDLNQAVLALMTEHKAGLPMLMKPLSGNASDQRELPKLIARHIDALQMAHGVDYVVADSALYAADHIETLDAAQTKFITRVPERLNEAKGLVQTASPASMKPLVEGYRYRVHHSHYGGVAQRWLVLFSEAAHERARKTLSKRMLRQSQREVKDFAHLTKQSFSCREDAQKALARFEKKLKVTQIEGADVLECLHMQGLSGQIDPQRVSYRLRGRVACSWTRYQEQLQRKSLFVLTTNELDEEALSDEEVLAAYKGQTRVERGFRFLKDPLFMASSLYLKSEKRIMALLMVMTLCLLVYAALEWRIRAGLRAQGASFPDQRGQPTQRPTARWVFESFVGIHVLRVAQERLVLNLAARHEVILRVLGHAYERLYASHGSEPGSKGG